ncbi:MAG: hypothetical protein JWM16_5111 [Verrucomicrobiales bacterium]|nr:hypothetical protein [Verrucomicrobiales bacterium]
MFRAKDGQRSDKEVMKTCTRWFGIAVAMFALAVGILCGPQAQAQVFHGAVLLKNPRGPSGTAEARVGEQVVTTITIINLDEFGDNLIITNLYDVVYHASGTEQSPNLLSGPLTIPSFLVDPVGAFVEFTYNTTVLPGDDSLPNGLLTDAAFAGGTDTFSGAGGNPLPFFLTVPGQIFVPGGTTNNTFCVIRAVSSPVYNHGGSDHALWLPGISTNLIFFPEPGSFTENGDGTARLTGTVRSLTNLTSGFVVNVTLSGLTTTPPPGSPKKDLIPSAYIENGGPIDTSTWHYYTDFSGTLTGFGIYSNAVLNIVRYGPAFQVGFGANDKNVNFGASGWFTWTVVQQPAVGSFPQTGQGDFNIDIIVCEPSALGDFVWQDLNGNGFQDPGEPGVPNVEVRLTDCSAKAPSLAVIHTDNNGFYMFTNLLPGNYRVKVVLPTGFVFTTPNAGDDNVDSDFVTNTSPCITLGTLQTNLTIDAGLVMYCPSCDLRYPFSSSNPLTSIDFNENEVLRGFSASPLGATDTIKVWYNDEEALMLGVREVIVKTSGGSVTNDYPISQLGSSPGSAFHPQVGTTEITGAQAGTDVLGRPIFPALFLTDITTDPNSLTGDWQAGGTGIPPHAVFGTWKGAVRKVDQTVSPAKVTVVSDSNPSQNDWDLGSGDPAPSGLNNEGYGAEVRWNVSELNLTPGHTYRAQVIVHDGDQTKTGGDAGQACVILCIPGSFPISPRVLKLAAQPSGNNTMTISGELDRNYVIESSEDMVQWKPVATIYNGNNILQFSNPNQAVRCFYRVKMLP